MTGPRAVQTLSYITLTMSIAPLVAPIIGGFLINHFGWQAIFVFLGSFGMLLFAATLLLFPESLKNPDPNALRLGRLQAPRRQGARRHRRSHRDLGEHD